MFSDDEMCCCVTPFYVLSPHIVPFPFSPFLGRYTCTRRTCNSFCDHCTMVATVLSPTLPFIHVTSRLLYLQVVLAIVCYHPQHSLSLASVLVLLCLGAPDVLVTYARHWNLITSLVVRESVHGARLIPGLHRWQFRDGENQDISRG